MEKTGEEDDFVRDNLDSHSPIAYNPCYIRDVPSKLKNMDPHPLDQQGDL